MPLPWLADRGCSFELLLIVAPSPRQPWWPGNGKLAGLWQTCLRITTGGLRCCRS